MQAPDQAFASPDDEQARIEADLAYLRVKNSDPFSQRIADRALRHEIERYSQGDQQCFHFAN